MTVIDDLRKAIDRQHSEAVEALRVLSKYLASTSSEPAADMASLNGHHATPSPSPNRTEPTNRDLVLSIIKTEWESASEIAAKTGLSVKQVRGVLNAPGLGDMIDRQDIRGELRYHWRDTPPETPL